MKTDREESLEWWNSLSLEEKQKYPKLFQLSSLLIERYWIREIKTKTK
jgi:hypothetical protein